VIGGKLVERAINGIAELDEIRVVSAVEDISFEEFPQSLDQVQVWRIRWQKHQLNVELFGQAFHQITMLIASVVEHQCDRSRQVQPCDFAKQFANFIGKNGARLVLLDSPQAVVKLSFFLLRPVAHVYSPASWGKQTSDTATSG
jgi:hypothetical protein